MRNFKLTVCYDGTRYSGWQRQGNTGTTIQCKLETLLTRLLNQPVELAASGRTDAGVHARAQVCSFKADTGLSCPELLGLIRQYLPEDIGAISLSEAPLGFHARLNCREKTYIYRIWNSAEPNVFNRRYMLSVPEQLDTEAMRQAAEALLGRHDFTSFCANKRMKKSAVRELRHVDFIRNGSELQIAFTGDGFLYNMVRILVGTLLQVGLGQCSAGDMEAILAAKDRSLAGPAAPAHGLILWEVRY